MRRLLLTFALLSLVDVALANDATADERFVQRVTIEPGLVAVVAEGDFEARSIGSYSVRVYSDPRTIPGNETTFYVAGLVVARDGMVRSAGPLVVAGRKRPLLMVVAASAGTGGYLSASAFELKHHAVRMVSSVSSLAPTEDPAVRLRLKLAGHSGR